MNDLPVRLALIGRPDEIATLTDIVRRVHGAHATFIADSMEASLRDDTEFDAAVVCSSVDAGCAAKARKHVLIDAPVADSIGALTSLLDAVEATGVLLAAGRLPRNTPANQTIIDRLSSGKLGDPGLLRIHHWSSDADQSIASRIFGHIDLAMHLFAATPKDIYAVGRGDGAYVQVHLGFPRGGMAVLEFSSRLPVGQEYESTSLIGSKGAAYADDHHNTHLLFAGKQPSALMSDSGDGRLGELQAFVDGIAGGASSSPAGDAILAVHRVIEAVERSIDSTQVLHEREEVYS